MKRVIQRTPDLGITLRLSPVPSSTQPPAPTPALAWWHPDSGGWSTQEMTMDNDDGGINSSAYPAVVLARLSGIGASQDVAWEACLTGWVKDYASDGSREYSYDLCPLPIPGLSPPWYAYGLRLDAHGDTLSIVGPRTANVDLVYQVSVWATHADRRYGPIELVVEMAYGE